MYNRDASPATRIYGYTPGHYLSRVDQAQVPRAHFQDTGLVKFNSCKYATYVSKYNVEQRFRLELHVWDKNV